MNHRFDPTQALARLSACAHLDGSTDTHPAFDRALDATRDAMLARVADFRVRMVETLESPAFRDTMVQAWENNLHLGLYAAFVEAMEDVARAIPAPATPIEAAAEHAGAWGAEAFAPALHVLWQGLEHDGIRHPAQSAKFSDAILSLGLGARKPLARLEQDVHAMCSQARRLGPHFQALSEGLAPIETRQWLEMLARRDARTQGPASPRPAAPERFMGALSRQLLEALPAAPAPSAPRKPRMG